jgi:hypothetical protein
VYLLLISSALLGVSGAGGASTEPRLPTLAGQRSCAVSCATCGAGITELRQHRRCSQECKHTCSEGASCGSVAERGVAETHAADSDRGLAEVDDASAACRELLHEHEPVLLQTV